MSNKINILTSLSVEDFRKPFEYGWQREIVYQNKQCGYPDVFYIDPSGKRLRTKRDVENSLDENLHIGMFTFAKKPLGFHNGEIIRVAAGKGFRAANASVSGYLISSTEPAVGPPTNIDNAFHPCSTNYNTSDDTTTINKSYEKYAMMDIDELRLLLIQKDDLIDDLRQCLTRNEMEIKKLRKQIKTHSDLSNEEVQNLIKILFPMLSENQVKIMTKQKKRVNWTCDEISIGFALSFFSRRGYVYLIYKLQYPLPAVRTLQLWAQNTNVGPGIQTDSLVVLQALRNSLTEGESQVILSFDEMKCKARYEYNKNLDCIMGPHSQMQTAMVRGLFSKFKQPIYVDFDKKMVKELLHLQSTHMHKIGFNVIGVVNNNGGGNVGLWSDCGVNFENHFIIHPETGEKIYMFSDAPHLLKLLRNWFIDGGFLLADGTELNQYRIRQLLESKTEISPLFKLSIMHLEVRGAERQNVRMASELFSHTVAESLRRHFPHDEVAHKLSKFIELVNNWFDIMNSYSMNGIGFKKPYGLNLVEQDRVLDEMYSTIKTMRCFSTKKETHKSLQIFQKGILMSINSVKALQKEMEKKFRYKYLLTHRLNQDCLENFYSQVRGRPGANDHPTSLECLYRIKGIILGKNPGLSTSLHTNTIEQDPEEYVSSTFMRHLAHDSNIISMDFVNKQMR